MRILVASDIHGSSLFCGKLLDAFRREGADRLLLLGDILYHGPRNDLPDGYAPREVFGQLNGIASSILGVRGNCDAEIDQKVLEFPMMAEYCLLFAGGRTIFATHGHIYNLASLPPLHAGDILLHGHTHVPCWERFGNDNLYLNPGSVSIPKENSPRAYMLLTEDEILWKDLDGAVFHREAL